MKSLNPALVSKVREALSGKRLEKFDASVAIINQSLAQGGWTPRGSIKAQSGFYQGLLGYVRSGSHGLSMALSYGSTKYGDIKDLERDIAGMRAGYTSRAGKLIPYKATNEQIRAWLALCDEKDAACTLLDKARPLPRVTPIGLSPKVTRTLTECNLDLDLPSIRMADLEPRTRPAKKWDEKKQAVVPVLDRDGKQVMETYYVVKWSDGIAHGMSRFAGSGCHACGKHIPSGRFVPVEAKDKRSGKLISMWLGCDCASNIFGIKDVGVEKTG